MSHYLDNYWKSRGFEPYNNNTWVKFDKNRYLKYIAASTSDIKDGTSTLKFFIRDSKGDELLASSDIMEIYEFFKREERDEKIDEILD